MITAEEFELLCSTEVRSEIERNIGRNPIDIALDKRVNHAALVATQVKYLQRARRKLPSFFEARCIVPPRAFEQSSSEVCAARKRLEGESVVDLTCGLGVDTLALARQFRRVVTVERDPVLADIARENFRRLGVANVEVVCDTAEHYVAEAAERFDCCFADPDRRGADGSKKVVAEECSPNMIELIPKLIHNLLTPDSARQILLKMSPMFDVDEALRVFGEFGRCSVEAVSLGDECKEVLVCIDDGREPTIAAVAAGRGEYRIPVDEARRSVPCGVFEPESYRYLIVPDVALQKARLVRHCFGDRAFVGSENGFAFASERPDGEVLGRVFEIEGMERYEPRRLRRELKGRRVEMLLRDVPLTAARIMQAAGVREGGDLRMAFTSAGGEIWAIRLK